MALSPSTKSAVEACPAEANVVRKVVAALKAAGTPVVAVFDGEEKVPVKGQHEVLEVVFSVDQAWLYTESGAWALIILGNEWDALSDYSVSLEDALEPVFDYLLGKD